MNLRLRIASPLVVASLLAAAPAAALDLEDGKLAVDGFGSVGYGRTDGNTYGPGTKVGNYENTTFALAMQAHPTDRLTVAGQVFFTPEGASIDWAFGEWKFDDALRLRLGKGKLPFGNYGEIFDVGTLRPFFTLPTSVYGPAEIVAEGYTGAGITGVRRFGAWSVAYDVYGGSLHLESFNALAQLADASVAPGFEEFDVREVIGARLSVETPVPGLTVRVSGNTGVEREEVTGEKSRHTSVAGSLEYLGEALTARAEYATLKEPEFKSQAAYVELAWKFRFGLELAGRVEGNWTTVDAFTGSSPLLRHREAAVGVNYWFAPDLVVKASYHLVDGNRFAHDPDLTAAPTSFEEKTRLFVLGAQFSF